MNNKLKCVDSTDVANSSGEGVFVKGVVTYFVADDLMVQPMSNCVALMNKGKIKDVDSLNEKVV